VRVLAPRNEGLGDQGALSSSVQGVDCRPSHSCQSRVGLVASELKKLLVARTAHKKNLAVVPVGRRAYRSLNILIDGQVRGSGASGDTVRLQVVALGTPVPLPDRHPAVRGCRVIGRCRVLPVSPRCARNALVRLRQGASHAALHANVVAVDRLDIHHLVAHVQVVANLNLRRIGHGNHARRRRNVLGRRHAIGLLTNHQRPARIVVLLGPQGSVLVNHG